MVCGHPPPHRENTQVLREAITEDDGDVDPLPSAENLRCVQSPCVVYIPNVYSQPHIQACKKNGENMSSAHYNFLTANSNTFQDNNAHLHCVLR